MSTDQTLRDLYSNTRGSVSSPRKIYFRRVKNEKQKKTQFYFFSIF